MAWLSSLGSFGEILRFIILILEVVLVFNLMIVVHEWGHFLAARWRGLKVEKFYIWFGKPLWKKTINGVEYGLGSIPAGGFVALPQMAPMGGLEGETSQEVLPPITPLDKAIVAFAGPLFSFMLACVFAVAVWKVGKPESESHATSVVGYVLKDSPAYKAGLQSGDKILSVDGAPVKRFEGLVDSVRWGVVASEGETIAIEVERPGTGGMKFNVDPKAWPKSEKKEEPVSWWRAIFKRPELRSIGLEGQMTPMVAGVAKNSPADEAGILANDMVLSVDGKTLRSMGQLSDYIKANPGKTIVLGVERAGKALQVSVLPRIPDKNNLKEVTEDHQEYPMVGITWDTEGRRVPRHISPWEQISDAVRHMGNLVSKLLSPKSDLSPAHMSGPVGVGRLYYKLFEHPDGWRLVLWFSVVFNINLAILNMMPFPVLDGGHITMAIAEAIRRKPPQGRILEYVQTACALMLFGFIIFVTLKDTGDIFGGGGKEGKVLKIEWLSKEQRAAGGA
ncbi:RIP metalloprotease RseP [Prosthecobacter fluviatilis]|uniref:RIP metalloprotease RseP n=1 Tax=Prosthecobacter fluviatilis TaxID=445931 RepID=A0ABW0KSU7_9BACT